MSTPTRDRKVSRVLVLVEYAEGSASDVFDLTALVNELATSKSEKFTHAAIELKVTCSQDYENYEPGKIKTKTEASWNAAVDFHYSGESGFLDDAINAGLPDSFTTQNLRAKLKRQRAKIEGLENDIQVQRLRDAATVRHQYPIARVQMNAALLPPTAP